MLKRTLALVLAVWIGVGVHLPHAAWATEGQNDILAPSTQSCSQLCLPDSVCNRYQDGGDLAQAGADIWLGAEPVAPGQPPMLPKAIRVASERNKCQINGGEGFPKPADLTCDAVASQALVCMGVAGQQRNYCASYNIARDDGYRASQATLIGVDTALAATCWTAFGMLMVPQTKAAGEVLAQVCNYGGIAESALQFAFAQANIATASNEWFGTFSAVVGGAGMLNTLIQGGTQIGAAAAGKSAGNAVGVASFIGVIINALMYTALAIARSVSMGEADASAADSCTRVQELASAAPPVRPSGWDEHLGNATSSMGGEVSLPKAKILAQNSGGGNAAADLAERNASCLDAGGTLGQCLGSQSAANIATGPDASIFNQHPTRLSPGGMRLRDYLSNLRKNGIASAIAAGAESMGMPAAHAAELRKGIASMQKAIASDSALRNRILGGAGGEAVKGAVMASKSGGGPAKPKGGFDLDWGTKTPAGAAVGAVGAEMQFAKPAEKLAPAEGDIWHETYKGSIFEIVSYRLDRSRTRVAEMEWQTPLNRALTGLKNSRPVVERTPAAAAPARKR